MTIPSGRPTAYTGIKETNPPQIYFRPRDPDLVTFKDYRNYDVGDLWQNTVSLQWFILISVAQHQGIWVPFTGTTAGLLSTLTGDDLIAVSPVASNINLQGGASGAIAFTSGGAGQMNAQVLVDGSTITIVGGQLVLGGGVGTTITGDVGGAISPTAGNWNILGSPGINTAGAANTLTISLSASVTASWATTSVNVPNMSLGTGYFCISPGGALTLGLPSLSSLGDTVEVSLYGATSWSITQAAGQQISCGTISTTVGAGGSLTSTAQGDSIRLVCVVPNLFWVAQSWVGNLTPI